jgi:hypothetical protein
VFAPLQGAECQGVVGGERRRDHHRVERRIREQVVGIRRYLEEGIAPLGNRPPLGPCVRAPADLDVVNLRKVPQKIRAPVAVANDADLHLVDMLGEARQGESCMRGGAS